MTSLTCFFENDLNQNNVKLVVSNRFEKKERIKQGGYVFFKSI